MEPIVFGRWRITADREATRRAYEQIVQGGPESCGCTPCWNFMAARDRVYPAEARDLFDRLGIVSAREAEV